MTCRDAVEVAGLTVDPGSAGTGWIRLGERPDGTPFGIPLMVVHGAQPGPRISLIAGVHGDEYDCCEGLRRFLSGLDPASLHGTIVATPQANPAAFEYASRHNPVDHLDLNRQFPGDPDGFLTERIADALCRHLVDGSDYLLDMHSGGMVLGLVPFVGFDSSPGEIGARSLRLAQATGIENLYASVPFRNVLRLVAAERGVASILVEIGSEGRLREEAAEYARRTLATVLHRLDMIPAAGQLNAAARHTVTRAAKTGEFLHAPTGGFLRHIAALGQVVSAGEPLGELIDPFGRLLASITAPHPGLIAEMRTIPACRAGDWTYAVLPVLGTISPDASLEALEALEELR